MWLVNNLKYSTFLCSDAGTDGLTVTGYIITTVVICTVFLIIIIISFFVNAKKTNKLCWVSKRKSVVVKRLSQALLN